MQEHAIIHNTDLTTAAFEILKNLKAWKNLETVQNVIKKAEERLSTLGTFIRQKEAALTTLVNLQLHGFSENQIIELTSLVNNWNARLGIAGLNHDGVKQLDTELIGTGGH